jgi:hypothetical protein
MMLIMMLISRCFKIVCLLFMEIPIFPKINYFLLILFFRGINSYCINSYLYSWTPYITRLTNSLTVMFNASSYTRPANSRLVQNHKAKIFVPKKNLIWCPSFTDTCTSTIACYGTWSVFTNFSVYIYGRFRFHWTYIILIWQLTNCPT